MRRYRYFRKCKTDKDESVQRAAHLQLFSLLLHRFGLVVQIDANETDCRRYGFMDHTEFLFYFEETAGGLEAVSQFN